METIAFFSGTDREKGNRDRKGDGEGEQRAVRNRGFKETRGRKTEIEETRERETEIKREMVIVALHSGSGEKHDYS